MEEQVFDTRHNDVEPQKTQVMAVKRKKEYYSDIPGDYIVDAKTGAKYPWKVGSFDEQRFFRVTNTVPIQNFERKGTHNSYVGRSGSKAFYENPHVYMKYCKVELDEEYVKSWYEQKNRLYPGMYNYPGAN